MCKISFIVPVYNVKDYIQECLDSLIEQSIESKEIIIINDGSTDGSFEICKSYEEKYKYIKVITKQNGGLSSARNLGIDNAKGEYIFFVDSDDFLLGDYLNDLYDECKDKDIDIVRCVYSKYNDNSKILESCRNYEKEYYNKVWTGYDYLKNEIECNTYEVIACLGLFRRNYLIENEIKFLEGVTYEDHEYFLRCLLSKKNNRIIKKNILIYAYRDRVGSITKVPQIKNINDMIKNINRSYDFVENLKLEKNNMKIAKIPVSVLFNHLISLYYRLPKYERNKATDMIKEYLSYRKVKYGYNRLQYIKIFMFFYTRWLLDLIYYMKSVRN